MQLRKLLEGELYFFIAIMLSSLVFLFYRILAARYLGPTDYGLLTLGIVILQIASLIGLVGVHQGIGKFINHYLAKKQYDKVKGTLISSFLITIVFSIAISFLLYFSSDIIENKIFRMEGLATIITIFSIGVPFSVLTQLFKYYFFTFKKPEYVIISETIFEKLTNILLLIFIIFISASIYTISWAYILALVISSLAGIIMFRHTIQFLLKKAIKPKYNIKQLISFSFPLMIVGILDLGLGWTDIIVIGIFKSSVEVGIYNVAYVIASSLVIIWISFGNIFYPIISELYAKNAKKSIRKTFEVTSRWIFILILPITVFVLAFPSRAVSLVFGQKYVDAAIPLTILIIGYFFLAVFGLSEQGLRTYKKTKFLGISTFISLVINIFLNILLVPKYGMMGAAIATTISLTFFAIIRFIKFKKILSFSIELHLYKKYIYSVTISFVVIFSSFKLLNLLSTYFFISAILLYTIFYFILLIFFKAFSREDIAVFEAAERKIGIRIPFLKDFLKMK